MCKEKKEEHSTNGLICLGSVFDILWNVCVSFYADDNVFGFFYFYFLSIKIECTVCSRYAYFLFFMNTKKKKNKNDRKMPVSKWCATIWISLSHKYYHKIINMLWILEWCKISYIDTFCSVLCTLFDSQYACFYYFFLFFFIVFLLVA